MNSEKEFFLPGDVVTLRQDIINKPEMIVVRKAVTTVKLQNETKSNIFQGIVCRWFSTTGMLQEATFNTKDLLKK